VRKDQRSLRFRIMVVAAATIATTLAVAAISLTILFERHIMRRVAQELDGRWAELAGTVSIGQNGHVTLLRGLVDPRYDRPLSGAYWQVEEEGHDPMSSRSLWDQTLPRPSGRTSMPYEATAADGSELYILARRVELGTGAGARKAILSVALDHKEVEELSTSFQSDLVIVLGLIAAALLVGTFLLINIGLAPLDALRRALQSVRAGDRTRLGSHYPTEVRPLAEDLDRMLDRNDALVRKARDRAGALAHGFKTPLTILSFEADRLGKAGEASVARTLREQIDAMRRLVEQELARAKVRGSDGAAGGLGLGVELTTVAWQLIDVMQRMPDADELRFAVNVPKDIWIQMDRDDLIEVLGNLIDNARKWASSFVEIRAATEGSKVTLEVADDGPGFDAPPRLKGVREGDGLGLDIVRGILNEYGAVLAIGRVSNKTIVGFSIAARSRPPAATGPAHATELAARS
jgi:signal transduction histidine kinase